MNAEFAAPRNFINRELSWLEFNRRVLEEAQDPSQPLLERVKFLTIFSSNLDEFFEIRVAGIKQQIEHQADDIGPDGLTPAEVFQAIGKTVRKLVDLQYCLWNEEMVPALAKHQIRFPLFRDLAPADHQWAHRFFMEQIFPVLTPLAVDPSHPFPQLLNKSHNLIVVLHRPSRPAIPLHAIVQIPRALPRLIRIPRPDDPTRWDFLFLKHLIQEQVATLFPGLVVETSHVFRVTRNSDLYIDEEEADNLLQAIETELRKRNRGNAVRLEVKKDCPEPIQRLLLESFKLTEADLYRQDVPLTMLHLVPLCSMDAFAHLRDRPFTPASHPALPPTANPFEVLREKDLLLHHPYETFDSVVKLVERAAEDPQVLAIKMTLYRTSGDSPVVQALIRAAQNEKQVTVLVELQARFDEANNIQWARQMEEAGVHVVYGIVGLKVHCKLLLVVRRDEDGIRQYVHLGTGNYHPRTARIYTDLGLLTTRPDLTAEVAALFNSLTGLAAYPGLAKLLVAPYDMADRLKEKIQRETQLAHGGRPGRIIAQMNALVDEEIIMALYEASTAGVKVDLIVRGICCLRPGLPGISENIRVISIVGRFLEHSRIFYFGNAGQPEVYLSSADWMPRNFYRRVEVAFPVEDPALLSRVEKKILPIYLSDCVKARQLQPDGAYRRLKAAEGQNPTQAQLTFREKARLQLIPSPPAPQPPANP